MTAIAALLAVALGATPVSQSKLGVVVLGDDATSRAILAACPRLAVFPIDPLDNTTAARAASQISAYKAACAGATVIVQVGGKGIAVAGTTAATNWASLWLPQILLGNTANVDFVEGPSEPVPVSTPADLAAFWTSFAQLVATAGFRPVVGSLPAGTSPVTLADGGTEDAFCATARQLAGTTFAWSYHARSSAMSTDANVEAANTLVYRQIRDQCAALAGKPLFLTEAGPEARAWRASDAAWLAFLEGQVSQDPEVQGAALFEAGGTDLFTLTPAVAAVEAHLANPSPADGGVPDGGADGGGRGGVTQGSQPVGGDLVPSSPKSGCSTGGPALLILALSPALYLLRRRAG